MGRGQNIRDWCYVGDHCRAIDTIVHAGLDSRSILGETFCVGGNSERTNLQITMKLLGLLGRDETSIQHVPDRLGHDSRYAIDSSKIKRVLGWEPAYDLETWLEKTVDWYKANQWWWEPLLKEDRPIFDPEAQRGLTVQARRFKER